jgi:hypothetical protein
MEQLGQYMRKISIASSMLTTAVVFKKPWRIATDVPLTSKELESATASESITIWKTQPQFSDTQALRFSWLQARWQPPNV